jgi:hypothetical protein
MARIRTIKPEFWSSEQVIDCNPMARLLFIGLWNFADDHGAFPDKPKQIKACVFPGDDFTPRQIDAWLAELSACGLIRRYEAREVSREASHKDERFLFITGWFDHQKIDHRSAPKYPRPPATVEEQTTLPEIFTEPSPKAHRGLAPESKGVESKGRERKGREGKGSPEGKGREGEPSGPSRVNGHAAKAAPVRRARDLPLAKAPVARPTAQPPDRVQQLTQPVLAHYGPERGLQLLEAYGKGEPAAVAELDALNLEGEAP